MLDKTYEDGVQAGRLLALEGKVVANTGRMDHHSKRIQLLERCIWAIAGGGALLTLLPKFQTFIGA